jgi:hypothetical protein
LPGSKSQNSEPATEPSPGEPLFTPAAPGPEAGIDPTTDESLQTPGQSVPDDVHASDTGAGVSRYAPPVRDRLVSNNTGQIVPYIYHANPIPRREWADAINSWAEEGALEHSAEELEESIATRERIQEQEGETSVSQIGTQTGAALASESSTNEIFYVRYERNLAVPERSFQAATPGKVAEKSHNLEPDELERRIQKAVAAHQWDRREHDQSHEWHPGMHAPTVQEHGRGMER